MTIVPEWRTSCDAGASKIQSIQRNRVMSKNTGPVRQPADLTMDPAVLQQIEQIPELFLNSYVAESISIHSLAETIENYQEHRTYQDVINHLAAVKNSVVTHFSQRFLVSLSGAVVEAESVEAKSIEAKIVEAKSAVRFHSDELSLVTDNELIPQLNLEKYFAASQESHEKMLLDSGWSYCAGLVGGPTEIALDCVRPGFLALMIQDALDSAIDNKQIVRIAYRFISAHFFNGLDHYYSLMLPLLTDAVSSLRKQLVVRENTVTGGSEAKNSNVDACTNVDVTGLLKNWEVPVSLDDDIAGFEGFTDFNQMTPDTQIHTASIEEITHLLQALSNKRLIDSDEILEMSDVRSALKESLSNLSDDGYLTIIDDVSENILNLVSHLFENVCDTNDYCDEVVTQISRVQSTVMQVALVDSKVFQSVDHPVRKYLNALSYLGLRVSNQDEEGYCTMQHSINTLLFDYQGDVTLFSELTVELEQYIDNSMYSSKWKSDEYSQDNAIENPKYIVVHELLGSHKELLKNELTFHKLVFIVWKAILSKIVLRHGSQSKQWDHAAKVYGKILWSTQVDADDEGKREILRNLPDILQGMGKLFSLYGLSQNIADTIREQMIEIHLGIIRGTNGKDITEDTALALTLFNCLKGQVLQEADSDHEAEFDALENVVFQFDDMAKFSTDPSVTSRENARKNVFDKSIESVISKIQSY